MKKRKKRTPKLPPIYKVGTAIYGPNTYQYKVYKDGGAFFIKFDGRFGPSTQVEREEDIETFAQEILDIFINGELKRFKDRIDNAFGFMKEQHDEQESTTNH